MIDYAKASVTYDNSRRPDDDVIELMGRRGVFERDRRVLDFGCGTGNYIAEISARSECEIFGLEPSDGMREKANAKNPGVRIEKGDHSRIPFESEHFDFIYMTDVIHHVCDLNLLFESLFSKLKRGALAQCARMAGFGLLSVDVKDNAGLHIIDDAFLRMVGEKNYSMFRMLSEAEYESGYAAMRRDTGKSFSSPGAGESLIWLEKEAVR
jgi:SAM-dependent methyltransferase